MAQTILYAACISSLQEYSTTYANCILKRSSIYLQIMSSNHLKIYVILHLRGGASPKAAAVLSTDGKQKLWDANVLNLETPLGLLRAVFFYNGNFFSYKVVINSTITSCHSFKENLQ